MSAPVEDFSDNGSWLVQSDIADKSPMTRQAARLIEQELSDGRISLTTAMNAWATLGIEVRL